MTDALRIGIAGLGTVGVGVLKILHDNGEMIAERAGQKIEVVAVSSRNKAKDRGVDISGLRWYDNALALAADDMVDVVVELIGGADGIAKSLAEAALKNGKHVVTANKAMIAHHGLELALLAEEKGLALDFEAAVAGSLPILQIMREGLAANHFTQVKGILNGTCNYILTAVREEKQDFAVALKEAQRLGYAEADPTFDVDGIDTAHKLAILSSLAFGTAVDFKGVHIEGIRAITRSDMVYADELGYVIKLLGVTERAPEGVLQRVHLCFVEKHSPIAKVDGVLGAVMVETDAAGQQLFAGRGAGELPTASAVMSDIIAIAKFGAVNAFGRPARLLSREHSAPIDAVMDSFYIRLQVQEKTGVLADVAGIFRDAGVSVRSFVQHSPTTSMDSVELALTTHDAPHRAIMKALDKIATLQTVLAPPQKIRIEE